MSGHQPKKTAHRYTHYNTDLGRYVVPLLYYPFGDSIEFYIKPGETFTARNDRREVYTGKEPDLVFGEVIDRLAELENKEDRHGEWIYSKTYYTADECNCSLCGQLMTTAQGVRMSYCPNCGAKMDGGAKA